MWKIAFFMMTAFALLGFVILATSVSSITVPNNCAPSPEDFCLDSSDHHDKVCVKRDTGGACEYTCQCAGGAPCVATVKTCKGDLGCIKKPVGQSVCFAYEDNLMNEPIEKSGFGFLLESYYDDDE